MENHEPPEGHIPVSGVDYKTVSMALSVVLMGVLSGSVGFWISRDQHTADAVRATDERQWERIQQLEKTQFEHRSQIRHLEQGQEHIYRSMDEREVRVRKMQDEITWLKSHIRSDRGGNTHE